MQIANDDFIVAVCDWLLLLLFCFYAMAIVKLMFLSLHYVIKAL